jgi:hypothetical protein
VNVGSVREYTDVATALSKMDASVTMTRTQGDRQFL